MSATSRPTASETDRPKHYITFDEHRSLMIELIRRIKATGKVFDCCLIISRGGFEVVGPVVDALGIRLNYVACYRGYDDDGRPLDDLQCLYFPPDEVFKDMDVLLLDKVDDTGRTNDHAAKRVIAAGGRPLRATLYAKPELNRYTLPDVYVAETTEWIVYLNEGIADAANEAA